MPTKQVERITSWSFSRYATYEECPAKARYKFIDRRKEPGSKAMDRGGDVHLLAEHAVKGTVPALGDFKSLGEAEATEAIRALKARKPPAHLSNFAEEFAAVRKTRGAAAELELAFTREWDPCDWRDWNRAWLRVKIDLLIPPAAPDYVVRVVDHKTGRVKSGGYGEQLELYAIGGMLRYPQAKTADTRLWYLDAGVIVPEEDKEATFQRRQLPKLIKVWEARVAPMLSDTVFAPRPGPYCRYCHFRKSNGGPCPY